MRKLIMVAEAYVGLIQHDLYMRHRDFAALHATIKAFPTSTRQAVRGTQTATSRALDIACALYPKQALCLQRSAVLIKLLRRRGIPAQMVFGAQKLPFRAHAWVEVHGEVVNDRLASREQFQVLEVC